MRTLPTSGPREAPVGGRSEPRGIMAVGGRGTDCARSGLPAVPGPSFLAAGKLGRAPLPRPGLVGLAFSGPLAVGGRGTIRGVTAGRSPIAPALPGAVRLATAVEARSDPRAPASSDGLAALPAVGPVCRPRVLAFASGGAMRLTVGRVVLRGGIAAERAAFSPNMLVFVGARLSARAGLTLLI